MFKRILIAVNRSEPGEHAADVGLELASELGATVNLVHVIAPVPVFATGEYSIYAEQPVEEPAREAEQLMRRLQTRVPEHLKCEQTILQGDPGEAILTLARTWRPDLIVCGSHGHGSLARLLLGSTAQTLTRHAECPVTVVRQTAEYTHDVPLPKQADDAPEMHSLSGAFPMPAI